MQPNTVLSSSETSCNVHSATIFINNASVAHGHSVNLAWLSTASHRSVGRSIAVLCRSTGDCVRIAKVKLNINLNIPSPSLSSHLKFTTTTQPQWTSRPAETPAAAVDPVMWSTGCTWLKLSVSVLWWHWSRNSNCWRSRPCLSHKGAKTNVIIVFKVNMRANSAPLEQLTDAELLILCKNLLVPLNAIKRAIAKDGLIKWTADWRRTTRVASKGNHQVVVHLPNKLHTLSVRLSVCPSQWPMVTLLATDCQRNTP